MADNSLPNVAERSLPDAAMANVTHVRVVSTDNSEKLPIANFTLAGTKVTVAVDGLSGTVDGAFEDVLTQIAGKADTTQVEALDTEKVDKTQSVLAGAGMTGGGTLAGDVTLNVATADDSLVVAADNVKVNTYNGLDSTSATRPLSAAQGKALDGGLVQVRSDLNAVNYKLQKLRGIYPSTPADLASGEYYFNDVEKKIVWKDSTGIINTLDATQASLYHIGDNIYKYNGDSLVSVSNDYKEIVKFEFGAIDSAGSFSDSTTRIRSNSIKVSGMSLITKVVTLGAVGLQRINALAFNGHTFVKQIFPTLVLRKDGSLAYLDITPDGTYDNVRIVFGYSNNGVIEQSVLDNTIVFNRNVNSVVEDIRIYQHKQFFDKKKYGIFQFGKGISLKYTPSEIPSTPKPYNSLSTWYDLYDNLLLLYPNYITKVDCDLEFVNASGVNRPTELLDKPIYMYKFIPKYTDGNAYGAATKTSRLKVLITTGTHAEYMAIWDLFNVMKIICQEWINDDNINDLRWNVEFYVIPCSGPYAVTSATRLNANGVDLNRNMASADWTLSGTLGDNTYSGPSPGSEYENKLLAYYIKSIYPTLYIDHHNFGVNISSSMMYSISKDQIMIDVADDLLRKMSVKWKKTYVDTFPPISDDIIFGYVTDSEGTGMRANYASDKFDMIGSVFETSYACYYNGGVVSSEHAQNYTPFVSTLAVDAFINYILNALGSISNNFSPNYKKYRGV